MCIRDRYNRYCSFLDRWIADSSSLIFQNSISRFSILDSRSLTLDSRVSKLERLDLRDVRIEFRGSSRDCQLTVERYCSCLWVQSVKRSPMWSSQIFTLKTHIGHKCGCSSVTHVISDLNVMQYLQLGVLMLAVIFYLGKVINLALLMSQSDLWMNS